MPKKKKETKLKREEMLKAFDEIQMARPPYVLEKMVVGSKFTEEQRYAQCVLELSITYDNLRIAECNLEIKEIEMDEVDTSTRKGELERKIKQVESEQLRRAVLGALREFECLYEMWEKFPTRYTREDLNNAQPLEYKQRLQIQAQHDMNAGGRISATNQEGLRQVGMAPYPSLDVVRDVEERYLDGGKSRILLAVATQYKAEEGLPCIEGLEMPNGSEIKIYNSWGRPVDDNYNHIVKTALEDRADYIITVEDDTFPPPDALVRLMEVMRKNPKAAVGAWYPKKEKSRQGVHIIVKNGKRQFMKDNGKVQEAYTMAMGCSIYPIELFMKIPYPWFKTTVNLSQDSFFSQLVREAGYKLLVDTSVKCKHVDRETGEVFE
ncbi:MAG: glycosyltransferase [bacterium]|nr:glycosyltransferase [bacterium]